MADPDVAELQRWSEEVARDPASMSFLPLARAYRRQGRRDAALSLCLRGLAQHPTHVGAHALLAVLYLESGDRELACDEWSTVLRLDPHNFEAHRGLGFVALERGNLESARRHLEAAAAQRPEDAVVRGALELLVDRSGDGSAGTRPPRRDPARIFEPMEGDAAFRGALILDSQGMVVAGTLDGDGPERGAALGAALGPTVEEAVRAVTELGLGGWRGLQLETERIALSIAPLDTELLVVVAADREAPVGWLRRAALQVMALARAYVEEIRWLTTTRK